MSIAFIVDGHLEKKAVQRLCNGSPVRMTNLNGKSVNIDVIVKAIDSLINLLKGRYFPIVIIVDREGRQESSIEIEQEILRELVVKGHNTANLIVACPDRMIENWIVAGTSSYNGTSLQFNLSSSACDGLGGKSILRSAMQKMSITYAETTTGVEMFCSMSAKLAAQNSLSFNRFHASMTQYCPRWSSK